MPGTATAAIERVDTALAERPSAAARFIISRRETRPVEHLVEQILVAD